MFYAQTIPGKHVKLNIASLCNQRFTKDLVFSLAQIQLCVKTLRNFPFFLGPNFISDVPTNGLAKC